MRGSAGAAAARTGARVGGARARCRQCLCAAASGGATRCSADRGGPGSVWLTVASPRMSSSSHSRSSCAVTGPTPPSGSESLSELVEFPSPRGSSSTEKSDSPRYDPPRRRGETRMRLSSRRTAPVMPMHRRGPTAASVQGGWAVTHAPSSARCASRLRCPSRYGGRCNPCALSAERAATERSAQRAPLIPPWARRPPDEVSRSWGGPAPAPTSV